VATVDPGTFDQWIVAAERFARPVPGASRGLLSGPSVIFAHIAASGELGTVAIGPTGYDYVHDGGVIKKLVPCFGSDDQFYFSLWAIAESHGSDLPSVQVPDRSR
jgi:hypothetical protein